MIDSLEIQVITYEKAAYLVLCKWIRLLSETNQSAAKARWKRTLERVYKATAKQKTKQIKGVDGDNTEQE